MAFELDFSKLDTAEQEPRDPYESSDRDLLVRFANSAAHRGTVDAGLEIRTLSPGLPDMVIRATADGTHLDIVATGQRADDFREVVIAHIEARRQEILDARDPADLTDADFDAANNVTATIIVEGFWKKRRWMDRQGNWRSFPELHLAKFHFRNPESDSFIEKGHIPQAR